MIIRIIHELLMIFTDTIKSEAKRVYGRIAYNATDHEYCTKLLNRKWEELAEDEREAFCIAVKEQRAKHRSTRRTA